MLWFCVSIVESADDMQRIDDIINLFKAYLQGTLTVEEGQELEKLFSDHPVLKELAKELDTEDGLREALESYRNLYDQGWQEKEEMMLHNILSRIRPSQEYKPRKTVWKNIVVYTSVAAVALIVIFASIRRNTVIDPSNLTEDTVDFVSGYNKAQLTLSNGNQINLSDQHQGIIIDEHLAYEDGTPLLRQETMEENATLILSTPRGGQYQATLSDGTKVWLNAESKLVYPHRFAKDMRHVELEGEAYFEVAHQDGVPFVINTSKEKVEVLGTHFNVNSYKTDQSSTVALLEGKVRVTWRDKVSKILLPGQQSVVSDGNMDVQTVNVEESVAWKNGEFMFNNETLESIMLKLSRWYDLDISVAPALREVRIWGSVSRYENFNQVLKLIKMTDDQIRLDVQGRRVKLVK